MSDKVLKVNGADCNIIPSHISPDTDYIKTSERAVSGRLHVDVSGSKQALKIVYDMLDDNELKRVKEIFGTDDPCTDGIEVEYDGITKPDSKYFVENVSYDPLIIESGTLWRNVTVDLVEV